MKVERMVKKGLVILAAAMLTASSANAANVETMGIGSMNTAQAGAVAAHADNVFAAYYNPAGLTLIEKPTLTVSTMFYDAQIKVYDWNVATTGTNDGIASGPMDFESDEMAILSPSMGFAMPVTDKITLGVAAYTPYGMTVTWDKDPSVNPAAAYAWESTYGRVAVTPTLAYEVSDKLSVGVGVSLGRSISEAGKTFEYSDKFKTDGSAGGNALAGFNAGTFIAETTDLTFAQATTPYDAEGNSLASDFVAGATLFDGAQMKLEATDDFNYSFNVGVMYRPIEQLSFGLTYRGRTETEFEGDATVTGALGGTTNLDGTATMEYDHPEQVQGGIRWFASNKLSVEADVTWTRWSINDGQYETITLYDVPGQGDVTQTMGHPRDWEDTTAYRLGISYQATDAFSFRAGYAYDPSPVPEETFDMGWPDTDRNLYSVGMGWQINERWMIDAVLQHIISTSKRLTENSHNMDDNYSKAYGAPASVTLEDEGILWGAGMTVTYTF
ncbi:OmpP1/FadL/TodX family outer membrane transporter [Desulfoluna limicola]|uniref:OmpP1/FadL/TodX family outer membrane transporter n=1 Tax=Desulfoluna limicola TaxID=2810562 RepID=A0ABM7PH53_9BACT|nr:outer membrane protein transport protein [Desulfoluna limicola]BCS96894.1 OmpP1/FadL/TodX family outer membrane transporter [Desulfoluna limicola]